MAKRPLKRPVNLTMMLQTVVGSALTLFPLLGLGFIFLRRHRPILIFYGAMCLVGFGYLIATGAIEDIGLRALLFATEDRTP